MYYIPNVLLLKGYICYTYQGQIGNEGHFDQLSTFMQRYLIRVNSTLFYFTLNFYSKKIYKRCKLFTTFCIVAHLLPRCWRARSFSAKWDFGHLQCSAPPVHHHFALSARMSFHVVAFCQISPSVCLVIYNSVIYSSIFFGDV